MLEPPLGGGAGERHVQRMPEPRRRVSFPKNQIALGYIALRETADRPILQFEIPGQSLALGIDLQTAIRHAVMPSCRHASTDRTTAIGTWPEPQHYSKACPTRS